MRTWPILSLALLLIAQPAPAETKQPRVIVDVYARRANIRKALLKHTPVGSSIAYVVQFISKQLVLPGSVPAIMVEPAKDASQPRVAKTISVYLGHYYKHLGAVFLTAPMVVYEDVNAEWLFDRHGRLIDIVVDKQARVY